MKFSKSYRIALLSLFFVVFTNCSSDEGNEEIDTTEQEPLSEEGNNDVDVIIIEEETIVVDTTEETIVVDTTNETIDPVIDSSTLVENLEDRFSFNTTNLVIENSYQELCTRTPCNTTDESLVDVFVNEVPDDPYFSLSADQSTLDLSCKAEEGRRIEFKQKSEGPLTSFSILEMEGVYFDVPANGGVTIAQVHNRGGSGNKPFFRLVLHEDHLETVVRRDPEVSSRDTTFDKFDFYFVGGVGTLYNQEELRVVVSKSGGFVHINVEQEGVTIIDQSYAPNASTRWVTNNGIANGFYLKGGLYNDAVDHTNDLRLSFSSVFFETEDED